MKIPLFLKIVLGVLALSVFLIAVRPYLDLIPPKKKTRAEEILEKYNVKP